MTVVAVLTGNAKTDRTIDELICTMQGILATVLDSYTGYESDKDMYIDALTSAINDGRHHTNLSRHSGVLYSGFVSYLEKDIGHDEASQMVSDIYASSIRTINESGTIDDAIDLMHMAAKTAYCGRLLFDYVEMIKRDISDDCTFAARLATRHLLEYTSKEVKKRER
jgi:hypothetical protein